MKIRVLHLITRLPVGGAERLMATVVRLLDPGAFESVVCCIQDGGAVAEEIQAGGVPVICLGLMEKGGFDRRVVPKLVELIREQKIGLVHSHLYHANLYGRLAATKAGIPAIVSVHNAYTRRKWYRHLLNRWLGRRSAAVIAVSADIRDDIVRYDRLPESRVIVLPNGIDPARVETSLSKEQARQKLGFGPDEILLVSVGRLEEQKGHTYLLQALARLIEDDSTQGKRIHLLLAGDGRRRQALEQEASALGIADWVHFLGTRSDMADVLRASDVFVMPSLWEGLSLAMLEGMAAGLPVVISDVGGAAEVLGANEYGWRVTPADVDMLANALGHLIGAPELCRHLGQSARRRVLENYSAQAMVGRLEDIYAKSVRERSLKCAG